MVQESILEVIVPFGLLDMEFIRYQGLEFFGVIPHIHIVEQAVSMANFLHLSFELAQICLGEVILIIGSPMHAEIGRRPKDGWTLESIHTVDKIEVLADTPHQVVGPVPSRFPGKQ